jgi:RNA polymerase sigma-70 factor (ECF subfamily)
VESEQGEQIVALIPRLRRYARALTGNAEQADDLVQDCLERGLSRFHLWRRGSDLRAWLFTIMHNLHVNNLRRARIRPDAAVLPDWDATGAVLPLQEDIVALRSIIAALGQLPDEQREVILLVGLEEMSYREAAAALGIPIGTVMSRLARGRERLRQLTGSSEPSRSRSAP